MRNDLTVVESFIIKTRQTCTIHSPKPLTPQWPVVYLQYITHIKFPLCFKETKGFLIFRIERDFSLKFKDKLK